MAALPKRGANPQPEQRRHSRFRYIGVVFLAWNEPDGENYVMGRCLDISVGGLGVEVARRIAVNTVVKVRAGWVSLDGPATVRHIMQVGGVFQLGLELKHPLPPEVLAKLVASNPEAGES
jgi:hypothetical protein